MRTLLVLVVLGGVAAFPAAAQEPEDSTRKERCECIAPFRLRVPWGGFDFQLPMLKRQLEGWTEGWRLLPRVQFPKEPLRFRTVPRLRIDPGEMRLRVPEVGPFLRWPLESGFLKLRQMGRYRLL
jgi:hypothetical protein